MPRVDMTTRRDALRDPHGRAIPPFAFGYEWVCGCGARLFIRSRVDRPDEPSNFDPKRQSPALALSGQKQQPSELNWAGLAEERGWIVAPAVQCPACQSGMSVADFKVRRTARPTV